MGAFNVLRTTCPCPSCTRVVPVAIQFKFGDTYQHEYAIGDAVRWGGNALGHAGAIHVVVDGVADGPCPDCGYACDRDFYVHVEQDRITRVDAADGRWDFVAACATFIVVRE